MTIDTTRLRAACESTARAQRDFRAADSAGSGHVAAAHVLMEACSDLSTHVPVILALLDEVGRLRRIFDDAGQGEHNVLALIEHYQQMTIEADERAMLAYPKALQAAAAVVTSTEIPVSVLDDAPEVRRWVDDVADAIMDLSQEQIEAVDMAQRPAGDTREWCWQVDMFEPQGPFPTREDAIADARDYGLVDGCIQLGRCDRPVTGFDMVTIVERSEEILADEGWMDITVKAREGAEEAFDAWCERYLYCEGDPWTMDDAEVVDLDEPEEGGEHG